MGEGGAGRREVRAGAGAGRSRVPSSPGPQAVPTAARPLQAAPTPGAALGDTHPLYSLLVDLGLAA